MGGHQLRRSEHLLLSDLQYYQANIAGLNTIFTQDVRELGVLAQSLQSAEWSPSLCSKRISTKDLQPLSPSSDKSNEERDILVLVHGFAGGLASWAQNGTFWAKRYHVYAINLPGFARSERTQSAASTVEGAMDYMTEFLRTWFEQLHFPKPVILLAHSFGCFVVSHLTMRYPSYVRLIILAEPWGVNHAGPALVTKAPLYVRIFLRLYYSLDPLALLRAAGPVLLRRGRPDFRKN